MKYFLTLVILILTLAGIGHAQQTSPAQETKWTRIETDKKELSVAFPPNFFVDAEKRERNKRYSIVGWQNGVKMELHVYKENNSKERLQRVGSFPGNESVSFTINGLKGKKNNFSEYKNRFAENIYLAADDYFYHISVTAREERQEEVKRFLYSIQVNGKAMYLNDKKQNASEEIISIAELKTSPEVAEAFNRKFEKIERKISRELGQSPDQSVNTGKYTRPPIVLEKPFPHIPNLSERPSDGSFEVTLKVNFLANGQIGDITAYSGGNTAFTNAAIESARKIRFVPAQIDGKNVDAVDWLNYTMHVFSYTTVTAAPDRISRPPY